MTLKKSLLLAFQMTWPVICQSMDIAWYTKLQANHQDWIIWLVLSFNLSCAIYRLSKVPMTPQPLGLPK